MRPNVWNYRCRVEDFLEDSLLLEDDSFLIFGLLVFKGLNTLE